MKTRTHTRILKNGENKVMKKIISALLTLALLICTVSLFSSCHTGESDPQGKHGEKGEKGDAGRGILKTEIIDGYLWITYTDDPENPINAGKIINDETENDHFIYQLNEDSETCSVVGLYNCMDTEIVIPSTYKQKPITKIGAQAFKDCTFLKSVTIPESVTVIGESAFDGCNNITTFTGPAEALTFSKEKLTSVTITNSTYIPYEAFYECKNLTSITLPNSVTEIGDRALYGCTGLTSVTLPENLTFIGASAFYGCTALKNITIPDSVTVVGETAFSECPQIIQTENGISYVDKWVIACDPSLTSVVWKNNTVGIGVFAIRDCTTLESITIPDSIIHISKAAISNCQSLASITVAKDNPAYYSDGNCIIEQSTKALVVGCNNSIIPKNITSIGDYAFYECQALTNATIPNSVTDIGSYAFGYCSNLTNITIPDSVTSIGVFAFYCCSRLKTITLPNSITTLERAIFANCTNLKNITIPDSVTSMDSYTFWCCFALMNVSIPDSVTSIGDRIFSHSPITTITFEGTTSQWNDITKGSLWNDNCNVTEVICSNGSVHLR